jgi:hypothetical protein
MLNIYQYRGTCNDIALFYVHRTVATDTVIYHEILCGEVHINDTKEFGPGWFDRLVRDFSAWSLLMSEDNA